MEQDVRHCAKMIAEERRLAQAAPSIEAAEVHNQLAMLYEAQLRVLTQRARENSV